MQAQTGIMDWMSVIVSRTVIQTSLWTIHTCLKVGSQSKHAARCLNGDFMQFLILCIYMLICKWSDRLVVSSSPPVRFIYWVSAGRTVLPGNICRSHTWGIPTGSLDEFLQNKQQSNRYLLLHPSDLLKMSFCCEILVIVRHKFKTITKTVCEDFMRFSCKGDADSVILIGGHDECPSYWVTCSFCTSNHM